MLARSVSSHSLSVVAKSDSIYGRISGSGSEDVDRVFSGIKRSGKYSRLTGRKDWTRGARISAEKVFRKASAAERSLEVVEILVVVGTTFRGANKIGMTRGRAHETSVAAVCKAATVGLDWRRTSAESASRARIEVAARTSFPSARYPSSIATTASSMAIQGSMRLCFDAAGRAMCILDQAFVANA